MIDHKEIKLLDILKNYKNAVIAFSGGCDSSYLLYAAKKSGIPVCAVTFDTSMYPSSELIDAKQLAADLYVPHKIIKINPLNFPELQNNPPERCYLCKQNLFGELVKLASNEGFDHILDGSNADDVHDYRPGRAAAKELGVKSPLEEAGFTKNDVRYFLKKTGSHLWDKPSMACYFSRFEYGTIVDKNMVEIVDKGEAALSLLGLKSHRLRHHGEMARVEVRAEDMEKIFNNPDLRKNIVTTLKNIGYIYVTLDLEGYRTGAMNETLSNNQKKYNY